MRKSFLTRAVSIFFFLGGFFLLILGSVSLIAGLTRSSDLPDGFTWRLPLDQVNHRALTPASALLPLTGIPAEDALNTALDNADWESAFAVIAYDRRLSDLSRIGALLQIGDRYAAAKNLHKAAWCYQAAALIVTLSPALSDTTRLNAYLQTSAGLRTANAPDAARRVVDQAFLVAQYTPTLNRRARATRLTQVANAYKNLGLDSLAIQARDRADESASATNETSVSTPRPPFVPLAGKLPASAEVDIAAQTRIAAAKLLVDDVTNDPPKSGADWPKDSVEQLRDALLQEDSTRAAYYDQQLTQAKEPALQIALWTDKVNWLTLKYRTARGAFGVDLVPEWGKDLQGISDSLSDAWGELLRLYEAQAGVLSSAQEVNQATEDVLKQELFAVRWGWYHGVLERDLRAALSDVTQKLMDASVPMLRLDSVIHSGRALYLLVPDQLYGQNENILPK